MMTAGRSRFFEGVVFDLDGLLVESEPLWRQAEREVFADIGLRLTEDDCRSTMGMRCDAVVGLWYERRPWTGPTPAEVQDRIEKRVLSLMLTEGRPMPGVDRALDLVERQGLAMAVASSSCSALIDGALGRLGLADRITVRCSAFDEVAGKPHPAVFLRAAERLGLAPETCIAFEDSPPGIHSARDAGMWVVAVPDPEHRNHPAMAEADLVLRTLGDLRPDHLSSCERGRVGPPA